MFFITGGSGFIGKYVVEKLLANQEEVIVLVRNPQSYIVQGNEVVVKGSLDRPELWKRALKDYPIDTCIHLAWEGIPDYSYEMSKKNLLYGLLILDLCKEHKIDNLIMTGSCWEYDNPSGRISVDNPVSDTTPFKASKNALRMMAHTFCQENQIHFNWLRLFYVYGPGQKKSSLIPYIIQSFKKGMQPDLNGAYNQNDFLFVSDAADAIAKIACNHIYPEILNIGSGYSTPILSIAKKIAETMAHPFDESNFSKGESSIDFFADSMEMYKDFSWKATVTIEQGIKQMIDIYGI